MDTKVAVVLRPSEGQNKYFSERDIARINTVIYDLNFTNKTSVVHKHPSSSMDAIVYVFNTKDLPDALNHLRKITWEVTFIQSDIYAIGYNYSNKSLIVADWLYNENMKIEITFNITDVDAYHQLDKNNIYAEAWIEYMFDDDIPED